MDKDSNQIFKMYKESFTPIENYDLVDWEALRRKIANLHLDKTHVFDLKGNELDVKVQNYTKNAHVSINSDGAIFFYDNQCNLHRLNGPAQDFSNRKFDTPVETITYDIHGIRFTKEEYWKQPEVLMYKKFGLGNIDNANDLLSI